MEITLLDGSIIVVLLINIEKNYIDWKFKEQSQHNKTDVILTTYDMALDEITQALENIVIGGSDEL